MDRESSKAKLVFLKRLPRRTTSRSCGPGEALYFVKENPVVVLALAYFGAHFIVWWWKGFPIVGL